MMVPGAATAALRVSAMVAVAVVGVGVPVEAQSDDDLADRLISSVDGFETVPEGGPVDAGNSGPVRLTELAALTGISTDELPEDMEGYMRLFVTPDQASYAMALGVATGGLEPASFVEGFEDAAAAAGEPLGLPTSSPWVSVVPAHEVRRPDGVLLQTAILPAKDGAVVLMITGGLGSEATLADMIADQAALTPPTPMGNDAPTPAAATGQDDDSAARRAGEVVGVLVTVGALIVLVVFLIARGRRQPPPPPGQLGST